MRQMIKNQPESGKTPFFLFTAIEDVVLDPYCRDEITKILRGIKEIYCNEEIRDKVFTVLEEMMASDTSMSKGRKGMDMWTIFVLGMLRVGCNWDYDKLKTCFDNHIKIRQMTGLNLFTDIDKVTSRQSIHDNVSLFTTETSDKINNIVVEFSQEKFSRPKQELHTRCDSFVFLSNSHFPTDFNLLLDCVRKAVVLSYSCAKRNQTSGWREYKSLSINIRRHYNKLSKMRYSNSKKESKVESRKQEIHEQVRLYLSMAKRYLNKARQYQDSLEVKIAKLDTILEYGDLLTSQINRRIFEEETIPADEKIYSIFEPYTEWICKGKAGVRQELGVKVCIVEDQFGFILHHRVMKKEQDRDIALLIAKKSKDLFPQLASISFDKGFHSKLDNERKNNRIRIEEELGVIAHLPIKGRPTKEDKKRESSKEFIKARKQHPAVESAINALGNHGLDRCPDRGEYNFDRYVSMAITSNNIHRLGALLMAKNLKKIRRLKSA